MWVLPRPGMKPVCSSLRGGFLATQATRAVPRVCMLNEPHGWFQESLTWWHFSLIFFLPRKWVIYVLLILQSWTNCHLPTVFFPFHTSSVTSFWVQLIGHMDTSSQTTHWRRVAGTRQTHFLDLICKATFQPPLCSQPPRSLSFHQWKWRC